MGIARPAHSLCFGSFQLNLRTGELSRNGVKVKVPDQSIQVLATLLERPGELVTREELHHRLWPNGTIVEFDHSINAVIKRLRQALEDSAEDPQFIETLPRRGYRFLVPVDQQASEVAAAPPEPEVPSDELAGKTISRYRILRKLGQGSMGIVHEAEDTKLGRSVALKFLPEEFSDDLRALERFEREARAASALNHPNIISVYDIGREKDTYWIVTELVQGETLCQLIAQGPLTVRKTIEIAVQVASGLASAHRAGIVHRDLKPSNIIVGWDGYVKIIDFGLATQGPVDTDSSARHQTNGGSVLGTAGYMSPEQIRGQSADHRSDIFSFGLILYEMLAGKQAFRGSSSVQVMDAILKDDPPALPQSIAPSIDRIVRRCMEKELARRFQSAADLEFALAALNGSQDLKVKPPHLSIRGRLVWAAATVVLAAGSVWTIAHRRHPDEVRPIPQIAYSGQDAEVAAAPDGRTLAFISARDSRSRLIVNADFSAVPVVCGNSYAYQALGGEGCIGPSNPQQDFNHARGFGWTMIPNDLNTLRGGNGLTGPDSPFNPPSFEGLPFKQAAFLQGPYGAFSQTVGGFVAGESYILSFYLGSRYRNDTFDGNQTIQALIDRDVIGTWALSSFTPFTLKRATFSVTTAGDHVLKFVGMNLGDNTAFLSAVGIKTATAILTVSPSRGSPGTLLTLTGTGFAPNEPILLKYSTGAASFPVGSVIAGVSGALKAAVPSPQAPGGAGFIRATGGGSGMIGSANFSTTPRLIMNPSATMVGMTAIAQGFGFGAGEGVEVYWSTPPLFLGTAKANREGSFHQATGLKFTIPAGAPAGANSVTGKGQATLVLGEGHVNVH